MGKNPSRVICVVGSFNRTKCLTEALESLRVANEKYPVEVIIADDFSTVFATQRIISKYRVITPEKPPSWPERHLNGRCATPINAVIRELAEDPPDYICFLPDDDLMDPVGILARASYLDERSHVKAVYGKVEACRSKTDSPSHNHGVDCAHAHDTFFSGTPEGSIANRVDHSMLMVRWGKDIPEWPEAPTFEWLADDGKPYENMEETFGWGNPGRAFRSPDAGWFFRLELTGFGPFHSVPIVCTTKRYHSHGWNMPEVRE